MSGPIATRRHLRAPRERVFDAFTEARLLARWWGPKGFTNTFHQFEPVPGGTWLYTMRAPDGTDFLNKSVFIEVTRPARIVIDHLEPMHRFLFSVDLSPREGGTDLQLSMLFDDPAEAARVGAFVAEANEQNLDRLEAVLRENE
jgi:uncharacterized protein YndB with AHSA1/START domain